MPKQQDNSQRVQNVCTPAPGKLVAGTDSTKWSSDMLRNRWSSTANQRHTEAMFPRPGLSFKSQMRPVYKSYLCPASRRAAKELITCLASGHQAPPPCRRG